MLLKHWHNETSTFKIDTISPSYIEPSKSIKSNKLLSSLGSSSMCLRSIATKPNNLLGVGLKCCTIKRFDDVLAAGGSRSYSLSLW